MNEPRRTRPKNRKQLILAAVGELCARAPYSEVTMEMVAERVGVTPGAIYKHYASKSELLFAAILASLDKWDTEPRLSESLETTLAAGAAASIRHRQLAGLILRESNSLDPAAFANLQDRIKQFNNDYSTLIVRARPELDKVSAQFHGWVIQAILSSPSFHDHSLPLDAYERILVRIAVDSIRLDFDHAAITDNSETVALQIDLPRREQVLAGAIDAFDSDGYAGASISRIGECAGLTGPSIYLYFENKQEIFHRALERYWNGAWLGFYDAVGRATTPMMALECAIDDYVALMGFMPGVVGIMVKELNSVPSFIRSTRADFVDSWASLVAACYPSLDLKSNVMLVETCFATMHNLGRKRFLREAPGFGADLRQIARQVFASGSQELAGRDAASSSPRAVGATGRGSQRLSTARG